MMIAKFLIVTGYFMHLKYDNPLFKRVFVFGLVLAVVVYIIMLLRLRVLGRPVPRSSCKEADVIAQTAGSTDFWRWVPHPEVWLLVGGSSASTSTPPG